MRLFFFIVKFYLCSADGKLMGKGKDFINQKEGKKGKSFEEIRFKLMDKEQNITIVSFASGEDHLIALDIDRNVWGWGSNKFKQLNPSSEDAFYKKFIRLDFLRYVIFLLIFSVRIKNRSNFRVWQSKYLYLLKKHGQNDRKHCRRTHGIK